MKNKERLIDLKNELEAIFKKHFKDGKIRIDDYTSFEHSPFLEIIIDEEDEITVINSSQLDYVGTIRGSKYLLFYYKEENKICITRPMLICPSEKVAKSIAAVFQIYLANKENYKECRKQ